MTTNFRRKQAKPLTITVMRQLYQDYTLSLIRSPKQKQQKKQTLANQSQKIQMKKFSQQIQIPNIPFQETIAMQCCDSITENSRNDCYFKFSSGDIGKYNYPNVNVLNRSLTSRKNNKHARTIQSNKQNQNSNQNPKGEIDDLLTSKKFRMKLNKCKSRKFFCIPKKVPNYAQKLSIILTQTNKKPDSESGLNIKREISIEGQTSKKSQKHLKCFQTKNKKKLLHFFRALNYSQLQEIKTSKRDYLKSSFKSHPFLKPYSQNCEQISKITNFQQNRKNIKSVQSLSQNFQTSCMKLYPEIRNSQLLNLKKIKQCKQELKLLSQIKRQNFKIIREKILLKHAHKQYFDTFKELKTNRKDTFKQTRQDVLQVNQ